MSYPTIALKVALTLLLLQSCSGGTKVVATQRSAPPGMVWIPPGSYLLGSGRESPDELGERQVQTGGFFMDRTEVTNASFKEFVDDTGYITIAERSASPDGSVPSGSACCRAALDTKDLLDRWAYVAGACWKHPQGPKSAIDGKLDFPVVHITFADALAYAKWAGKDLPTQDEWEVAARGGLVGKKYEWGDEFAAQGEWRSNTYQGMFPRADHGDDGFKGLAPVGSFEPNGYGLSDMTGNAWELTKDLAPDDETSGQHCRWAKGGSFLCAANYCARYRPAARIPIAEDTSTEHVGFRCVVRGQKAP